VKPAELEGVNASPAHPSLCSAAEAGRVPRTALRDQPQLGGSVRRVVVLPGLWAPLHHRPAVAALTAFVRDTRPDGVVFLDAPAGGTPDAWEAFTAVVAGFRAEYAGPISARPGGGWRDAGAVLETPGVTVLARLGVTMLAPLSPVAPGWLAAPDNPMAANDGVLGCAREAGGNLVCGDTGRLRLTGRAIPCGEDGGARAWLVFECGTLAADPAAGTLGFGVLVDDGTVVSACPVRVGIDGSFTIDGARRVAPAGTYAAGKAGSSSVNSTSTVDPLSPAM